MPFESVRLHGRRVTKVGPEVKHGRPEGLGARRTRGCDSRTWTLPDVSAGGACYDRFGVEVVEPRMEGRFAWRSVPECTRTRSCHSLAQDALDDILLFDERNDAHFLVSRESPETIQIRTAPIGWQIDLRPKRAYSGRVWE